jgi:virginiamycin A acetyltransferase
MLKGLFKRSQVIPEVTRENPAYSTYEIGAWTYGKPAVLSWNEGAKLQIGKYCSIAAGVTILLGGEHRPDWVTTYPFNIMWTGLRNLSGTPTTRGDVIIGNDVWIGRDAFIVSGVKIGNGAVIGARSMVTKNVAPYTIVAGNPARVVRERFTPEQRDALLKIAWWTWPETRIREAVPLLLSGKVDEFIQTYTREM